MENQYYIVIKGQQAGPFPKEILKLQNLSGDTLVWRVGLPDWVKMRQLPELEDILTTQTHTDEETPWFAMINGQQVGPLPVESLISMGLNPSTPVWRAGMPDWVSASTQTEIMRHFGNENNNRNQTDFANNPQYGSNYEYGQQPNFSQNPQYGQQPNYGYNNYQNPNGYPEPQNNSYHTNWLIWAIVATIIGCFASCIAVIPGIIGIVNANKANGLYAAGFDEMGDAANSTAKTMTIIALVISGLGLLSFIFLKPLIGQYLISGTLL